MSTTTGINKHNNIIIFIKNRETASLEWYGTYRMAQTAAAAAAAAAAGLSIWVNKNPLDECSRQQDQMIHIFLYSYCTLWYDTIIFFVYEER